MIQSPFKNNKQCSLFDIVLLYCLCSSVLSSSTGFWTFLSRTDSLHFPQRVETLGWSEWHMIYQWLQRTSIWQILNWSPPIRHQVWLKATSMHYSFSFSTRQYIISGYIGGLGYNVINTGLGCLEGKEWHIFSRVGEWQSEYKLRKWKAMPLEDRLASCR